MRIHLPLFFGLLLLSGILSGCFADDPTPLQVKVGDRVQYRFEFEDSGEDKMLYTVQVEGIEQMEPEMRTPCEALRIGVRTEADDRSNLVCLDDTFYSEAITDSTHPTTGEPIRQYFFGSTELFSRMILCSLACTELADQMSWKIDVPPDYYRDFWFERTPNADVFVLRSEGESKGMREWWNATLDFRDGPYPSEIILESGIDTTTRVLRWVRTSYDPGTTSVPAFKAAPGDTFVTSGTRPWDAYPPTAGAPFEFGLDDAIDLLRMHPAAVTWFNDHSSPVLALARYGTYDHVEKDETEFLWGMQWADGTARLEAHCHELHNTETPVPTVDRSCFHVRPSTSSDSITRSDAPAETVGWGSIYEEWSKVAARELPIGLAQWSMLNDRLGPGMPNEAKLAQATFTLSFYRGEFDYSEQPVNNWLVSTPQQISRAAPLATSTYAADDGRPFYVTIPRDA